MQNQELTVLFHGMGGPGFFAAVGIFKSSGPSGLTGKTIRLYPHRNLISEFRVDRRPNCDNKASEM